jgi:hypothetical protein
MSRMYTHTSREEEFMGNMQESNRCSCHREHACEGREYVSAARRIQRRLENQYTNKFDARTTSFDSKHLLYIDILYYIRQDYFLRWSFDL